MTRSGRYGGAAALLALAARAGAQRPAPPDTAVRVSLGAFVDAYYAWDLGRPPSFDRSFAGGTPFTTQPARHDEFNVNLAFVEAMLRGRRIRGRVALQAGTSVQSNYAGEPTNGVVGGPTLARHVQEAVAGYEVADGVWVDAGIFYANAGMEGWVSRDNLTYTRSLVADYSPYYSSGVKLTWAATSRLTARVDVVNGWQNVSESNAGKSAGLRLDYAATPSTTLSYYNLVGEESGTRLRTFNGIGARHAAGRLTLLGQLDVGTQERPVGARGRSSWYGVTAIARAQATPRVAVSARAEGYHDADQVIVGTGGGDRPNPAFRGVGGSVGLDVSPEPRLTWRTELRGWWNRDALHPDGARGAPRRTNGVAVSSLALTL